MEVNCAYCDMLVEYGCGVHITYDENGEEILVACPIHLANSKPASKEDQEMLDKLIL